MWFVDKETQDNEGKGKLCLLLRRAFTQIINFVGRTHKLYELAVATCSEQN